MACIYYVITLLVFIRLLSTIQKLLDISRSMDNLNEKIYRRLSKFIYVIHITEKIMKKYITHRSGFEKKKINRVLMDFHLSIFIYFHTFSFIFIQLHHLVYLFNPTGLRSTDLILYLQYTYIQIFTNTKYKYNLYKNKKKYL